MDTTHWWQSMDVLDNKILLKPEQLPGGEERNENEIKVMI